MEVMEGLPDHKVTFINLFRKSGPWYRLVVFMSPKRM